MLNVRRSLRRRGTHLLSLWTRRQSDEAIERRLALPVVQRGLFTAMARSFEPKMAFGFQGEIQYELRYPATAAPPAVWTIEVRDSRASARPGPAGAPAVVVRIAAAALIRLASGDNPGVVLLDGQVDIEGDLGVAMRLVEMFGGPSPY